MYGELNFNPTLFIAQMKAILPLFVGVIIALFLWVMLNEHLDKKKESEKHESHI